MDTIDITDTLTKRGHRVSTVAAFLKSLPETSLHDRHTVVEQAQLLMDEIYVHLPLKMSMHAVNPVQQLRLLRQRLEQLDERQFQAQMIQIFAGVRDLHTNYVLPAAFHDQYAVLPFEIGRFYLDGEPRYVVTSVFNSVNHTTFKAGVAPTHLNGIPIHRAVQINAELQGGSNPAASLARGLERLTLRPLSQSYPPEEHWMTLRFIAKDGEPHEVRFPWLALDYAAATSAINEIAEAEAGLDSQTEAAGRVRRELFQGHLIGIEKNVMRYLTYGNAEGGEENAGLDWTTTSKLPQMLSFRTLPAPAGQKGYIRIHSFSTRDSQGFANEFKRILDRMPAAGLVIDVRRNGGGNIIAGELILQLLTASEIDPERFHLINTEWIRKAAAVTPWLAPWVPSLKRSVQTGSVYTQGLHISSKAAMNQMGRTYHGPVVLLIDAFCYSTTDIFAAGFKDHAIGKIIGTDTHTGAGGANVLTWSQIAGLMSNIAGSTPFKRLPGGANMRVAFRRSTRVGEMAGVPLEDLGVAPDIVHPTTVDDLLKDDQDLLRRAVSLLEA